MSNKKEAAEALAVYTTPKPVPKKVKRKRLAKVIDGTVLSITEAVTETTLTFDFATLPESIQALLGPYGMSQKLGDAAAGKKGQAAIDAINRVWEGLSEGNWSVRAPAAEKISKKSILGKFSEMPEGEEKDLAKKLLENLGIAV